MVLKIHKQTPQVALNSSGITLAELLAAVAIIILISSIVSIFLAPQTLQARTRDNKRISDLSVIERAISEYSLDNANYPDTINIVRTSNTLPTGNLGPVESAVDGWLDANMSKYLTKLPVDPINNATYHYTYTHNKTSFELNALLENQEDYMLLDGGNNAAMYEIGNNLSLIN